MIGRLMTMGDGVFFAEWEVDRRRLDLERKWSGDPTPDTMEHDVFEEVQSFRYREKLLERGSLPSGKRK